MVACVYHRYITLLYSGISHCVYHRYITGCVIQLRHFHLDSLRSRRLEVVGTRKNGRARRRYARGEEACLPRARPFSLSPATSKRLLRRLSKWKCLSCITQPVIYRGIMGKALRRLLTLFDKYNCLCNWGMTLLILE